MQEQIQLFNSLPAAQQQALVRELQRNLPPAQRQSVISLLRGGEQPEEPLAPEAEAAVRDALEGQAPEGGPRPADAAAERLGPGDTVVIEFVAREEPEAFMPVDDFHDRLSRANPYLLDSAGQLLMPGVPAIPLAGLDVDQATVRIQSEAALRPFTVILTRLPLQPLLEPFGYDLFRRSASAFAPAGDIPVPTDYVIGPGDTFNVQFFGTQNVEYFLTVSREGAINIPEIGPINVSGQTFDDARATITNQIQEQLIGVRASITLGELRSIRVFVLGDVARPGSYSVSGLSTVTNALFASGGIRPIGSLRNIALLRNGVTVSTLDLYDLLLRGDTRGDLRLQPGDAILVPPVGARVAVSGELRRPGIYEVKAEQSVADLLDLAGGLNARANRTGIKLERVVPNRGTTVQDIDLTARGGAVTIRDGDALRVLPNIEQLESSLELAGNVFQPGRYQWSAGMRLTDLLPSPAVVKPMSDVSYVLIKREVAPNVKAEVLSADLEAAWRNPSSAANVALMARDMVYVFNLETGREHIVEPILKELQAQTASIGAIPTVRVDGEVRAGGTYPLEPGMTVSDLLRAGGGLTDVAYASDAELTRYAIISGEYRETELITVDLAAVLRGDARADVALAPYDYLTVKQVARWRGEETVTMSGEVTFPGRYPIRRGETLSSVIARAGGLTELAFADGSVFTREDLREREREQLEALASQLERDLATIAVSATGGGNELATGQTLIEQLRNAVPTGRLVIRLDEIIRGVPEADVVLKDGDELLIPDRSQTVTILGEVQYPTSHIFSRDLDRNDYLSMSGGLTPRADQRRIYVVRASGAVADSGRRWFSRQSGSDIRPGDTIVVPLKVDQALARWTAISQLIYSLSLGAAAINSF